MNSFREGGGAKGRAWLACLVACLLAFNGFVAALASTGVGGQNVTLGEALALGPVCVHVGDDGAPLTRDQAPAPEHPIHCALCVLHHANRLAAVDILGASAIVLPPRKEALVVAAVGHRSAAPDPQSGRASSWSPRAPPFCA